MHWGQGCSLDLLKLSTEPITAYSSRKASSVRLSTSHISMRAHDPSMQLLMRVTTHHP